MLGDRPAALAELRLSIAGPNAFAFTPAFFRLDPLWSRLKDDPLFEEILKTAKPL